MGEIEKTEKASSIEVSRNAKGEYAFKVKIYYDTDDVKVTNVISVIETAMNDLKSRFK